MPKLKASQVGLPARISEKDRRAIEQIVEEEALCQKSVNWWGEKTLEIIRKMDELEVEMDANDEWQKQEWGSDNSNREKMERLTDELGTFIKRGEIEEANLIKISNKNDKLRAKLRAKAKKNQAKSAK